MAILKRPMFRKGGSANEGIMHGLERRGYADSNIADIFKNIGSSRGVYSDIPLEDIPKYVGPDRFQWPDWMKPQKHKITTSSGEEIWTKGGIPIKQQKTVPPEAIRGYDIPIPEVKSIEDLKREKDDGGIDGLSANDAKTIIADKKSMLSDRAKEFAELLSPGAQKRAIYDSLAAASESFGKSTGNTRQDIANAISAAAKGMGGATDTYQKARLLAIEEDIKKTIAEAGKADYKPNATQSLINYLEDSGMTKEEVAAHLTSKSAKNELDYIRAYPTTPEAIGAYVSKVESKDIKNFGGVLSNNPKERKEELKTLPEGQIYFDSAKNEYVTITKDAEGDREFKFLKKR